MTNSGSLKRRDPVSITEWVSALGEWAKSKGWGANKRSVLERLALVHSEVSEIVLALRDDLPLREISVSSTGTPTGVPIEIADVVMRLLVLCAEENIDLERAMNMKLAYNRTRPTRHGRTTF